MTDRELLEQALEALLLFERAGLGTTGTVEAITTLRERLARQERAEAGTHLSHLFALANNMANNAEVLIGALQPYAPLQVVHKSIVQPVSWLQESVDRYHAFAQSVHDMYGSKLEKEK